MASVYVRGKSLWLHYSINGVLYRKSLRLKNTKQNMRLALNKCFEIEELLEKNELPIDDDVSIKKIKTELQKTQYFDLTITQLLENYISIQAPSYKNAKIFRYAVKKISGIVDVNLKIDSVDEFLYNKIKEYLLQNLAYETARSYINYLRILFNFAINRDYYKKKNPFIRLKRREKKYITIIPDEHFDLILTYLKELNIELYRFIVFIRYTGFRLTEALMLEWQQIKFSQKLISLTTFKDNNRNDIFPLNIENGALINFLLPFKKESGKVFNTDQWAVKKFQKAIESINTEKKEADKNFIDIPKYTIHDIRRTFGSKYANKLMPIELMKLMRHKDITTTLRYYVNIQMTDIADKLNKN